MQSWHRWREPVAVLLLVLLGLTLALRVVGVALALSSGTTAGWLGSMPTGDHLLVLLTAGAVLWCATPVSAVAPKGEIPPGQLSPHARPISLVAIVLVGVTVLGWTVLTVSDVVTLIGRPTPDAGYLLLALDGLLRLVVPAAALTAVVVAVRRAGAARPADAGRRALPTPETAETAETAETRESSGAEQESRAPERLPAAWQPDEATGAVWLTADDAAQGRPGMSWSEPAATGGQEQPDWSPREVLGRADATRAADEAPLRRDPPTPSASDDDDLR